MVDDLIYRSFNDACGGTDVLVELDITIGGAGGGGSIAEVGIAARRSLVACILGNAGAYLVAQGMVGIDPVGVAGAGGRIEIRIAGGAVNAQIPCIVGALDPAAGGGAECPSAVLRIGGPAGNSGDVAVLVKNCLSGVAVVIVTVAVVVVVAHGGVVVHDDINFTVDNEADHVSTTGADGINRSVVFAGYGLNGLLGGAAVNVLIELYIAIGTAGGGGSIAEVGVAAYGGLIASILGGVAGGIAQGMVGVRPVAPAGAGGRIEVSIAGRAVNAQIP